jgi:hypothetical protein
MATRTACRPVSPVKVQEWGRNVQHRHRMSERECSCSTAMPVLDRRRSASHEMMVRSHESMRYSPNSIDFCRRQGGVQSLCVHVQSQARADCRCEGSSHASQQATRNFLVYLERCTSRPKALRGPPVVSGVLRSLTDVNGVWRVLARLPLGGKGTAAQGRARAGAEPARAGAGAAQISTLAGPAGPAPATPKIGSRGGV